MKKPVADLRPMTPPTRTPTDEPGNYLLYDGECPVCSRCVAWSNLKDIRPDIQLLNAREHPPLVALWREQGVEINDSMVLKLGELRLSGHEAVSAIARLDDKRQGLWTQAMRFISRESISKPLYPLLVAGRKLLLRLLRRKPIR